jgi:hypothetical protein
VVVDASGRLRHEQLLGDGWPFVAYDAGFKLMTAVTSRRAGEIVATWTYRQVREWGPRSSASTRRGTRGRPMSAASVARAA